MKFESENELEDMLFTYFNDSGECAITGEVFDYYERQVNIQGYGIIDILGIKVGRDSVSDIIVNVHIIELKNEPLKPVDVSQISKYYIGVKRYVLNVLGFCEDSDDFIKVSGRKRFITNINGHIVAPDYDETAKHDTCFLVDSIPWLSFYTFSLGFYGVTFESSDGWFRKNEAQEEVCFKNLNIKSLILRKAKEKDL